MNILFRIKYVNFFRVLQRASGLLLEQRMRSTIIMFRFIPAVSSGRFFLFIRVESSLLQLIICIECEPDPFYRQLN